MIYLASAYSHNSKRVRELRFKIACVVAGELMNLGKLVFSPIAHSHSIAQLCDLPGDYHYWSDFDEEMIGICTSVIVIKFEGWDKSAGVKSEIELATKYGRPVSYIDLATSFIGKDSLKEILKEHDWILSQEKMGHQL